MDIPHEVVYSLIDKVRASEQIWNVKHKNFKSRTLRRMNMVDISKQLQQKYPKYADKLTTGKSVFWSLPGIIFKHFWMC